MIAEAALQEDVDAIGLSILSGAHLALFPRIMDELRQRGLDDVTVWAGGIIPEVDVPALHALGIRAVFGPGSPTTETIEFLRRVADERAAVASGS
jgi:methylmalonyl-CoA mutase C-terminal domain/subunit